MEVAVICFIILGVISGLTRGVGVLPNAPLPAAVGEKVMFTTSLPPTEIPFITVNWAFGRKNIITSNVLNTTGPDYEGRITLFISTASLELRNLTLNDSGEYTVHIIPYGEGELSGTTRLDVYARVANIVVTLNTTDLVEFNNFVLLSCSSSGSSPSFLWLNGSSEVAQSDRVQFSNGGASLTIVSVTRYDQGPFRCHVFNPVSNDTSDPVKLSISYGPENINVALSPSQEHYEEGSDISLMCSAVSKPSAQFMWFLNGEKLPNTGPELRLTDVQESQSGNYSCQAFNNKTLRHETSQRVAVSVLIRVANTVVTLNTTDLVEFNSSVLLSCSSSGSSPSFLWLNGSSEVAQSDRVQFSNGGASLTIVSVTRYDQGPFRCHVFNPVSNDTSDPVKLSISYGPENINVALSPSQEHYEEGSDISLMCSAVSKPSAQFMWFLNGEKLPNTGPELRLTDVQESQSGNYSCQAFNNKTLRHETSQRVAVSVLIRVANTVVTLNTTDLVEFNSSVLLSCSSSGSSPSFLWLNGSSEVTQSDRIQFSNGGASLTIVSVTRYDQGPFRCHVFNPVNNDTSDPVKLSISYGPENINLTVSLSQEYYGEGSNISLMCSAVSKPSAQFMWFLNGEKLTDTGPELRLINIQMSQSGNYSCQAFNNKTLRYEMSQPAAVSVLERISNASVTSSSEQVIEGNSVNLTCDAAGSIFTREWMMDGSNLAQAFNQKILSLTSLSKKDKGEYSCKISNPINSELASYIMVVNYGPENVRVEGPSEIHLKKPLRLNCFAESTPAATYIWTLNGKEIHNSSVFTKNTTEASDSGNYTCEVRNHVTGRILSVVHHLSVTDRKPGGVSAGAIAGIVITCLIVAAAGVAGGSYIFVKKVKGPSRSEEESHHYGNISN